MGEREAAAKGNRERMPETAKVVDAFRLAFGPGVVVRYATEGGVELGTRGPVGVPLSDWTPPVITDGRL
jgi:hypothetical protein